jgi:transposase-like protein
MERVEMTNQKKQTGEAAVREIRRRTRRKFSPEEKIRIVLEGLRGEESVSDLCRREGIHLDVSVDTCRRVGRGPEMPCAF